MKEIRTKSGQTLEAKWALGPLSNGQVLVDLPGDHRISEIAPEFEALEALEVTDEKGVTTTYRGYTELIDVQRALGKNETRLIFARP